MRLEAANERSAPLQLTPQESRLPNQGVNLISSHNAKHFLTGDAQEMPIFRKLMLHWQEAKILAIPRGLEPRTC